jgi:hypothetical protein
LQPRLVQIYDKSTPETRLHLALELSFPHHLVKPISCTDKQHHADTHSTPFLLSVSVSFVLMPQTRLVQIYDKSSPETGLHLALELSFPHHLVKHAGAPQQAWITLESPPTSHLLHLTLVWQGKTPTRLPEALWLRFRPGRGSVDPGSWLMHKLDGAISPSEVSASLAPPPLVFVLPKCEGMIIIRKHPPFPTHIEP